MDQWIFNKCVVKNIYMEHIQGIALTGRRRYLNKWWLLLGGSELCFSHPPPNLLAFSPPLLPLSGHSHHLNLEFSTPQAEISHHTPLEGPLNLTKICAFPPPQIHFSVSKYSSFPPPPPPPHRPFHCPLLRLKLCLNLSDLPG